MDNQKIVIYQTEDGQTQIDVRLENETVWLTQAQMAELFQKTPQNITMHIRNAYKEGELEKATTCKEYLQVQMEGNRTVKRIQKFYDLDVIISVGYRVKSKRGTAFRIWARNILKQYLIKGFAVNERARKEQIGELRQLVGMLGRTLQSQPVLSTDEASALFEVVTDYTYALDTLDNYDYERLTIEQTTSRECFHATYEGAMAEIDRHPLPPRRLEAPGRQHPRRPHPDDSRKPDGGKGRHGEGRGEPDKPTECVRQKSVKNPLVPNP